MSLWLPPSSRNTRHVGLGGKELFVWYENAQGRIIIPINPEDTRNHRPGYQRKEATSTQQAEKVSARFRAQLKRDREHWSVNDRLRVAKKEGELADKLRMRMAQSSCSPYEKDVIRAYLKRMDEGALRKKEVQIDGFLHSEGYEVGKAK